MGFALSDLATIPVPALPVTLNNIPETELAIIQAGLRLYGVSMYVLLIPPGLTASCGFAVGNTKEWCELLGTFWEWNKGRYTCCVDVSECGSNLA